MNDPVTFKDLLIIGWVAMAIMIVSGLIGYYTAKWKINKDKSNP